MANVAVIIVTWNSSHFLGDVLCTVSAQTLKPTRVLIIDNGSKDVSSLKEIVGNFPDYELITLSQNKGFAAANNFGISLCKEMDFVALLNPDAFPEPNWLETLVMAADRNPGIAAFGSLLIDYSNHSRLDGAGDFLSITGKPGRRGHGLNVDGMYCDEEEIFSPCAAAALYRLPTLLSVGGFDESFFCYIEDVDLAFRLLLAGYRSKYIPEAIALHMGSAITGRHSDFSVYYGHRNLVWNYVKNMPGFLFWVLLPLHLILNFSSVAYFIFKGQGDVILRAKIDAIKGLPKIWRKRREIQNNRIATIFEIWQVLDKSLLP